MRNSRAKEIRKAARKLVTTVAYSTEYEPTNVKTKFYEVASKVVDQRGKPVMIKQFYETRSLELHKYHPKKIARLLKKEYIATD